VIPADPFPAHPFEVLRTPSVAEEFILHVATELGLHFAVIPDRRIIEHRPVQLNNPAGPDNAYLILLHKILGNVTLLAGP